MIKQFRLWEIRIKIYKKIGSLLMIDSSRKCNKNKCQGKVREILIDCKFKVECMR